MPTSSSRTLSPSITSMIRFDHKYLIALFHRYRLDTTSLRKAALVANTCAALEIHAQLKEEIFYPALRRLAPHEPILEKCEPDNERIRDLIGLLRGMKSSASDYDTIFLELMREALHHMVDEETTLLPLAERLLRGQLRELGARMTRRRLQLLGRQPVTIAATTAVSFPLLSLAALGGVVYLARRVLRAL